MRLQTGAGGGTRLRGSAAYFAVAQKSQSATKVRASVASRTPITLPSIVQSHPHALASDTYRARSSV